MKVWKDMVLGLLPSQIELYKASEPELVIAVLEMEHVVSCGLVVDIEGGSGFHVTCDEGAMVLQFKTATMELARGWTAAIANNKPAIGRHDISFDEQASWAVHQNC